MYFILAQPISKCIFILHSQFFLDDESIACIQIYKHSIYKYDEYSCSTRIALYIKLPTIVKVNAPFLSEYFMKKLRYGLPNP